MALYTIENVTFSYPDTIPPALRKVSMRVEEGDFVLICGSSGSGKSTLLRQLKREVTPEGERTGSILYQGMPLEQLDDHVSVQDIGMVFQDPEQQIVMNTVWQEITFGMENLGYTPETIQRRVGELVQFFGMEEWLYRSIHELSGGQKQLLNLAAIMSLRPRVLLLDEPTAQLDPIAAKQFIQWLERIHEELSVTIIISEHRVEELFPLASKVVIMDQGQVQYNSTPQDVIRQVAGQLETPYKDYLPVISRMSMSLEPDLSERIPLTVKEGRQWLRRHLAEWNRGKHAAEPSISNISNIPSSSVTPTGSTLSIPSSEKDSHAHFAAANAMENRNRRSVQDEEVQNEKSALKARKAILECKELVFTYSKDTEPVLKRLSLCIEEGEWFTLFGGNGTGKTTLLHSIAGVLKPQRGKLVLEGQVIHQDKKKLHHPHIGYVAQNPVLYFTRETVHAQLMDRLDQLGVKAEECSLEQWLRQFELHELLDKHPFDISGGQQQKLALMLVLLAKPKLLLLDEPTKGLDPIFKRKLAELLIGIQEQGTTILMVSHDIEFAACYSNRCGLLFDGSLAAVDEARAFLQENYFYTTVIHRMTSGLMPDAITIKDVQAKWAH